MLAQIGSGAARAHRELGAHDQRLLLGSIYSFTIQYNLLQNNSVVVNCVFFVIERKISTSLSQLMKRGLQGQGSDLGRRIQDFTDL